MSAVVVNEVRKGFYLDSVALMRSSRHIAGLPGIAEAALMMGSPSNKAIMANAGILDPAGAAAGPNDLIIGLRAETPEAAAAAVTEALRQLDRRDGAREALRWRPRSLQAALDAMPDANLALISVPGDFAAAEALQAIRRGLNVMIFSDNVSVGDERAVKREARERGRLVMGPDCGTAIINGIPLAFANKVPRGDIGIIGASGTGMQEVSSLLAQAGLGVSQAIGVGGRDLSEAIGGITTLMAIDALDADPATRRIVLISKPPHPAIASDVLRRVGKSRKQFTICFIGAEDLRLPVNAHMVPTLEAAAEDLIGRPVGAGFAPQLPALRRSGGSILGLYSGGTLCAEAQIVLTRCGRRVASNAPVPRAQALAAADAGCDRIIDLGADEYTRGRPHPMIDPITRDDALRRALADPTVAVILVDVVIGFGAHADPAGAVAAVVADGPATGPQVIASVTGTEADPQVRSRQVAALAAAGVIVAPSNAKAAALAAEFTRG
jgi:FdrA protein